jgi:hypothetical protein
LFPPSAFFVNSPFLSNLAPYFRPNIASTSENGNTNTKTPGDKHKPVEMDNAFLAYFLATLEFLILVSFGHITIQSSPGFPVVYLKE